MHLILQKTYGKQVEYLFSMVLNRKRRSIHGSLTGLNVQMGRMSSDTDNAFTDDSFGQCRQLRCVSVEQRLTVVRNPEFPADIQTVAKERYH